MCFSSETMHTSKVFNVFLKSEFYSEVVKMGKKMLKLRARHRRKPLSWFPEDKASEAVPREPIP